MKTRMLEKMTAPSSRLLWQPSEGLFAPHRGPRGRFGPTLEKGREENKRAQGYRHPGQRRLRQAAHPRALRPRFPAAVYFTTDLDARLLHAEEWASARNLVVASGYGLRLNDWLQQEIPPFRDSYQTSYFLSVQAALLNDGDLDKAMNKLASSTPRIFEIGRSQPVDLSVTETDIVKCDLASCNSPHPDAGPPADLPWKPYLFATVLLLLAIWYWNRRTVTYLRVKARASIAASLRYPQNQATGGRVSLTSVLPSSPISGTAGFCACWSTNG